MLSNILSPMAIARHIVSVSLLAGAATTMVAGSADSTAAVTQRVEPATPTTAQQHGELDELIRACIESHDKNSDACQKAIGESGLSAEEFYAKVAARFESRKKHEPKAETPKRPEAARKPETPSINADLEALIKDCIAKYTSAAKTADGSAAAKEACMRAIEAQRDEKKPEPKPESRPAELVKSCVNLAAELKGDSSREDVEKVAAVCTKAKDAFDH